MLLKCCRFIKPLLSLPCASVSVPEICLWPVCVDTQSLEKGAKVYIFCVLSPWKMLMTWFLYGCAQLTCWTKSVLEHFFVGHQKKKGNIIYDRGVLSEMKHFLFKAKPKVENYLESAVISVLAVIIKLLFSDPPPPRTDCWIWTDRQTQKGEITQFFSRSAHPHRPDQAPPVRIWIGRT